eukprot:ctg_709.g195
MFVLAALVLYVFYVSLRRALVLFKRERRAQTAANAEPESVTVTDPEERADTDDDKEDGAHLPDSDAEPGPAATVGAEEPPPTNGDKEHNEHPPDAPAASPRAVGVRAAPIPAGCAALRIPHGGVPGAAGALPRRRQGGAFAGGRAAVQRCVLGAVRRPGGRPVGAGGSRRGAQPPHAPSESGSQIPLLRA